MLKTSQQIISPKYYYDGTKYPNDHVFKGNLVNVDALKSTSPLGYTFISKTIHILEDTK